MLEAVGREFVEKNTPPRESVCQYVCKGRVRHGPTSEDGKRWNRLHVQKTWVTVLTRDVVLRHRELRADKRLRDDDPDPDD